MMSPFHISRKAPLGPGDCQRRCPGVLDNKPTVPLTVACTGMWVRVQLASGVARWGLTIAAQAAVGADPVQLPSEATRVSHYLGGAKSPQSLEDFVSGPRDTLRGSLRSLRGFCGALVLLERLQGRRLCWWL